MNLNSKKTNIHITFSDTTAADLKRLKERVIAIPPVSFSIGPIYQVDTKEGQKKRQQWLAKNLSSDYIQEGHSLSDFIKFTKEIQSIPKEISITIWMGDHVRDHLGLCFILSILKERNNIRIINASEACKELFQKEYDISMLLPEEVAKIHERFGKQSFLTEEAKAELKKEWEVFSKSTGLLRIWKDNQVLSVEENHLDDFIVKCARKIGAQKTFCKAVRLIGEALGHVEYFNISDEMFFEYRLRALVKQGVFKAEGSLTSSILSYSVQLISES
ncbi:DUF1835 domain-containing protein [Leptospira santarosai]|uniref:DUF1835 domain-containing protein n=1 Tax=Leptospira santarosai TaxID=28183 RepID=UPI0002BE50CC|nr:DUF1835 domain-containing protein [Leptospira santarosai]EMM75585.1 PF12395 family protein [Leptospira santarosai str. 2000030832]MDI7185177.1 DUF1835 domain-containing protein [Leptospira santarosai]MDI7199219.1 DUF1835 domain-containing protein [Leptospira santarosai]MDI7205826.1 DUF1835 domain-containing protein [Leptospira santarosai]MDI7206085.1 DUF1835 domain-containing protein [Leptospira santarosai]